MGEYGSLFWVGKYFGWVGVVGDEWGWVGVSGCGCIV